MEGPIGGQYILSASPYMALNSRCQKVPKGAKRCQMGAKGYQKGAKIAPRGAKRGAKNGSN